MDLSDDTKITLKFNSNIFSDLSKIVSNNSYTIRLPNTVHNQCAILHADIPSCDTAYPRINMEARYFRNGVEILDNATSILLSTSNSFDFALTWGNISRFANIVDVNKSLRDLKDNGSTGGTFSDYHHPWIIGEYNSSENDSFFVPKIEYGFRKDDVTAWYHPCVKVAWILSKIMSDNGVTFTFPQKSIYLLGKLMVPLLTRNDNMNYAVSHALKTEFSYYVHGRIDNGEPEKLYLTNKSFSNYYGEVTKFTNSSGSTYIQGFRLSAPNMKMLISGKVSFSVASPIFPNGASLILYYVDGDDARMDIATIACDRIEHTSENDYYVYFDFKDVETNATNEQREVMFGLIDAGWISDGGVMPDNYITIVPVCDMVMPSTDGSMTAGRGHFPIIANLPDIKQIDFIKTICTMLGVFAVPNKDNPNVIDFVSVDTIIDSKSKAYDWTKKVIASSRDNKPNKLEYKLDNFAQKNNLCYKPDDTVSGYYNGSLNIMDFTLERERDAVTLPFAGTDMAGGSASIRLYRYDADGVANLESVEPRILLFTDEQVRKGTFEGLNFASLIDMYYKGYSEVIYMPKIITENIEISDIELKDLDMTIPVYLAQYGRYYAIISVKAEDTGICECKLLQLEV